MQITLFPKQTGANYNAAVNLERWVYKSYKVSKRMKVLLLVQRQNLALYHSKGSCEKNKNGWG